MFLEGRANISGGEGRYLWRVEMLFLEGGLIFLEGVFMFVEGRAVITGG